MLANQMLHTFLGEIMVALQDRESKIFIRCQKSVSDQSVVFHGFIYHYFILLMSLFVFKKILKIVILMKRREFVWVKTGLLFLCSSPLQVERSKTIFCVILNSLVFHPRTRYALLNSYKNSFQQCFTLAMGRGCLNLL